MASTCRRASATITAWLHAHLPMMQVLQVDTMKISKHRCWGVGSGVGYNDFHLIVNAVLLQSSASPVYVCAAM